MAGILRALRDFGKPRQPVLRLVCGPSVTEEEAMAARAGLKRFEEFGLPHEMAGRGPGALEGLKRKRDFGKAVLSEGPIVLDRHRFLEQGIIEAFAGDDGAFGVGIVSMPLSFGEPEPLRLIGAARFDSGALVTVARIREICTEEPYMGAGRELGLRAIAATVVHEVGHVLIDRSGEGRPPDDARLRHCLDPLCIMQASEGISDLIWRVVPEGLDFCRDCSRRIAARMSGLLSPL